MKILKWGVIVLAALAALGFALPDEVVIERSAVIPAEPGAIHPHVSTLKSWPEWTPWSTENDPTADFQFSGADSGVGSKWSWKGDKFEQGELEIVESDPAKGIRYKLAMAGGMTVNPGRRHQSHLDRS
jgi:hypothetical protein